MKKIVLILASVAITVTSYAQKVALHTSSGVQHFKGGTALQSAYTASSAGDTIYLSGGGFNPPANFDKHLVIFGAGHYVDSTLATGKTIINGNVTLNENADLFYIEGVEINGTAGSTTNHSVDNVTIKNCKINGTFNMPGNLSTPSANLALIGNVFVGPVYIANVENALISNCIIQGNIADANGAVISNNIILFNSAYVLHACNNNQINNNIFVFGHYSYLTNGATNIYKNNLFVTASLNYGTAPTTIDNYEGVNPADIFVNQTGTTFNYTHDYHLQDPTRLGTDNTQIGIYGGAFPYKEGAVPSNPHIQEQTIAPTATNGQLNVQIKAAAQDN